MISLSFVNYKIMSSSQVRYISLMHLCENQGLAVGVHICPMLLGVYKCPHLVYLAALQYRYSELHLWLTQ